MAMAILIAMTILVWWFVAGLVYILVVKKEKEDPDPMFGKIVKFPWIALQYIVTFRE